MPIYEYRCGNGHTFEVFQSMSDDPVTSCEECGAPVERVYHPIAVHYKGSGFYSTDYAGKGKDEAGKSGESGSSGDGDGAGGSGDSKGDKDSKKSGSDAKKSESKDKKAKTASSSD